MPLKIKWLKDTYKVRALLLQHDQGYAVENKVIEGHIINPVTTRPASIGYAVENKVIEGHIISA